MSTWRALCLGRPSGQRKGVNRFAWQRFAFHDSPFRVTSSAALVVSEAALVVASVDIREPSSVCIAASRHSIQTLAESERSIGRQSLSFDLECPGERRTSCAGLGVFDNPRTRDRWRKLRRVRQHKRKFSARLSASVVLVSVAQRRWRARAGRSSYISFVFSVPELVSKRT